MKNPAQFIALCGTWAAGMAACCQAASGPSTRPDRFGPFVILPEDQIQTVQQGMVMQCPAHAHGTVDQAERELKEIMARKPAGKSYSIYVCRANQLETLRRFAPLADQVVVNSVLLTSKQPPEPTCAIFPGYDHPLLNQMRLLRFTAGSTRLLGCIDVNGDALLFAKRSASFEEIQWMTYATVGSNFHGVVWRETHLGPTQGAPSPERFSRLQEGLLKNAKELGKATPVAWAVSLEKHPISALASPKCLFVTILNPVYMTLGPDGRVNFPASPPATCLNTILISPPTGIRLVSGRSLAEEPVNLVPQETGVRVEYSFRGGGALLTFDLTSSVTTRPDVPSVQGGKP